MKLLILASLLISAVNANASTAETQDNVNHVIVLADNLSQEQSLECVEEVKTFAVQGHPFWYAPVLGVITANVTTKSADAIAAMSCVRAVEAEQMVEANPRVGRQN